MTARGRVRLMRQGDSSVFLMFSRFSENAASGISLTGALLAPRSAVASRFLPKLGCIEVDDETATPPP